MFELFDPYLLLYCIMYWTELYSASTVLYCTVPRHPKTLKRTPVIKDYTVLYCTVPRHPTTFKSTLVIKYYTVLYCTVPRHPTTFKRTPATGTIL